MQDVHSASPSTVILVLSSLSDHQIPLALSLFILLSITVPRIHCHLMFVSNLIQLTVPDRTESHSLHHVVEYDCRQMVLSSLCPFLYLHAQRPSLIGVSSLADEIKDIYSSRIQVILSLILKSQLYELRVSLVAIVWNLSASGTLPSLDSPHAKPRTVRSLGSIKSSTSWRL